MRLGTRDRNNDNSLRLHYEHYFIIRFAIPLLHLKFLPAGHASARISLFANSNTLPAVMPRASRVIWTGNPSRFEMCSAVPSPSTVGLVAMITSRNLPLRTRSTSARASTGRDRSHPAGRSCPAGHGKAREKRRTAPTPSDRGAVRPCTAAAAASDRGKSRTPPLRPNYSTSGSIGRYLDLGWRRPRPVPRCEPAKYDTSTARPTFCRCRAAWQTR